MRLVEESLPYETPFANHGGSGGQLKRNELLLDTRSRRRFAKSMRGKLKIALGNIHPTVDFSGRTSEPQTVEIIENTHRTIIAEPHALTITTTKTDNNNLSQTIHISVNDSGEFAFEETLLWPDHIEATDKPPARNSPRAQDKIKVALENFVQEAAPEKPMR